VSYHADSAVTEIRPTRAALRTRALLGLVLTAAALAGGCAHGNDLYALADGNFKERDFERALKRYRKLGGEECTPEGTRRLCCAGSLCAEITFTRKPRCPAAARASSRKRCW